MTSPQNEYEREREALGLRLRELRTTGGLTGQELAAAVGISQSKISKIETGRLVPSGDDVNAILDVLNPRRTVRAEVLGHLEALQTEFNTYRLFHRRGLQLKQAEIAELERSCEELRFFQPTLVPGLLQTAEYAREVIRRSLFIRTATIAPTVKSRLERQTLLYEEGRTLTFIVTEAALRSRFCSRQATLAQIDRIESLSTLSTVELGVVPFESVLPAVPHTGFTIYDDRLVALETLTHHNTLRDERDVKAYIRVFDEYRAVARFGDSAREVLRRLSAELLAEAADAA